MTAVGQWLSSLSQLELVLITCVFCPLAIGAAFFLGWVALAAANGREGDEE